jgi:hypothetical protein
MDAREEKMQGTPAGTPDRSRTVPLVTSAEREFWRRAVAAERARQRCGRPTPFPFQPA